MSTPTFDLLAAPWLECRSPDGSLVALGLREVLVRAHTLDDLAATTPLAYGALMRMLVALVHAVLAGPQSNGERAAVWRNRRFDPVLVDSYCDRFADRFDLFDPVRPFWQCAAFQVPDEKTRKTVAVLSPELSSGNNFVLFDHTLDRRPPAPTPARAAAWLATHQVMSLGAGVAPSIGQRRRHNREAPAMRGASLHPRGANLFETLVLNAVPLRRGDTSRPIWERDFPPPEERVPAGRLEYLTWPNRAVQLIPEEDSNGVVVRQAQTMQGAEAKLPALFRDPYFPMTAAADAIRPLGLRQGRALWRDSAALFGLREVAAAGVAKVRPSPDVLVAANQLYEVLGAGPAIIRCSALAAVLDSKRASFVLWRHDELAVPRAYLADTDDGRNLVDALTAEVEHAETVASALYQALRTLAERLLKPTSGQAGATDRADPKQVAALLASWRGEDGYWAALDAPFVALLRSLPANRDQAGEAWRRDCRRAAEDAFQQVTAGLGDTARALRARVLARQAVTTDWTMPHRKTKGAHE